MPTITPSMLFLALHTSGCLLYTSALNQAVKAVAIARGFVAPGGIDLVCVPAFTDIFIEGEERTAIKLIVEQR